MVGAVLLVGDELLAGTISDRNVPLVATALRPKGVQLETVETVGDDVARIVQAVSRLARSADLLVVTGGLGPTEDDVTREAVARLLGVELVEHAAETACIVEKLSRRGIEPGPLSRRQGLLPAGTEPIGNPLGTAPGIRARLGRCELWVLPGVPAETSRMIEDLADALPVAPGAGELLVATAGLTETRVAEMLETSGYHPPAGVRLGYLPSPGGVRLRLAAGGEADPEALSRADAELRGVLRERALPGPSIEKSLVMALVDAGATLSTAESCTGGMIGARITDVPGASSVYLGGIVSYSNRVKIERLGVPAGLLEEHGAVSEPVVRAMADGGRTAFGAALAVAVTGIAGPGGGTPDKPVGTVWLGVASETETAAREFRFPGNREMIRERSVNKALEMAYRRVRKGVG